MAEWSIAPHLKCGVPKGTVSSNLTPSAMEIETDVIARVQDEYERSLEIPSEKPERQFLLCPVGLIGAGKTTVTTPLATRLSLVRISADDVRKLLKENGLGYEAASDICHALAIKYIQQGHSIAIDSDCASPKTQEFITKAAEEFSLKIIWIHIDPPEAFILNKFLTHEPSWLFQNPAQAIENYEARKPLHENLTMPFTYTFDTSKENLPEQLNEAVSVIRVAVD